MSLKKAANFMVSILFSGSFSQVFPIYCLPGCRFFSTGSINNTKTQKITLLKNWKFLLHNFMVSFGFKLINP